MTDSTQHNERGALPEPVSRPKVRTLGRARKHRQPRGKGIMDTMTTTHQLKITHGTSRAQDTYGYNTVTLTDEQGRRFKCMGGGYDMFGTVLAQWLTAAYPERTAELAPRAYYVFREGMGTQVNKDGLYGVYHDASAGRTWLDGAVGRTTVERLAKDEYGLTVKATVNGKGHTIGWTVTD